MMDTTLQQPVDTSVTRQPVPAHFHFTIGKLLAFLILVGISILFVVPFIWMISTSLKEPSDLGSMSLIPARLAFENYRDAFSFGLWPQWTFNTVVITLFAVIGQVLS